MRLTKHSKLFLLVALFTLFALGGSLSQAQDGGNLLTNPGFESPFISKGGSPERFVANGWEPWHVPPTATSSSAENQQPEYREAAPDSSRIRSGNNAQEYSTFFATHTGGVYQRVTGIAPGTELSFSVYAYIWSSTFEDLNRSESPGDVIVFVGIDPTGGTDGASTNIVWSPAAPNQYDDYRQYSVTATAASNAVTVFVRSIVGFPVQNNFIYLDDAVLEVVSPPPATSTPVPTEVPQVTEEPTPTATNTPPIPSATPTNTLGPPPFVSPPAPTSTNTPAPPIDDVVVEPANTAQPVVRATLDPTVFPNRILHTVQRGDTVGRLSVLYGSTNEAIITANNLNDNGLIFVGQGLQIPVRLPAPATITPSPAPILIVTPTEGQVTELGIGGPVIPQSYTVQRGDTLSRIAAQFGTTVAELAQINGIVNPNRIAAGQVLLIYATGTGGPTGVIVPTSPAPTAPPAPAAPVTSTLTYIVQPGDNLYRISLRFNVSMLSLQQANNISNVNLIFAGQQLIIPPA